jgi:predicted dehydrogenase
MSRTISERKIRYAVIGLGHISQAAVLPAFEHTADSELCALVSNDETKRNKLAKSYGVDVTGGYDELERVLEQSHADALYVATPNTQHRSHTERAARAGVHVLCEKPMAETVEDCQAMIESCRAAGVRLMIAYRLHFDEAHLDSIAIVRGGQLGVPRIFSSLLTQQVKRGNIRTRRDLAGGALYDLGIYPINSARHLFGAEPISAVATSLAGDERFDDVDATTSATLTFADDRIAQFTVSLAASAVSSYRLLGERGNLCLEPAYAYDKPLEHVLTIGDNSVERRYLHKDQFAAQLSAFSRAIRDKGDVIIPTGEEGLADVRVVRALLESQASGRQVELAKWPYTGRTGCG